MTIKERLPIISLLVLSILVGLLWRVEVEYHGWAGLTWLSYFHLAIPMGFSLFIVWGNFFIALNLKKRILINVLALIYGLFIYYVLEVSLIYNFASGPGAMLLFLQTAEWKLYLIRFSILIIIPSIPIGTYLILKLFKKEPKLKFLIMAIVGIIISIPLTLLILEFAKHKGGHDLIHSIKSGILIPFWIFSVGLLIVAQANEKRIHNNN